MQIGPDMVARTHYEVDLPFLKISFFAAAVQLPSALKVFPFALLYRIICASGLMEEWLASSGFAGRAIERPRHAGVPVGPIDFKVTSIADLRIDVGGFLLCEARSGYEHADK